MHKSEVCTKPWVVTAGCHQPDKATGWVVVAGGGGGKWLCLVVGGGGKWLWLGVGGGGRGDETASVDTTGGTLGFTTVGLWGAQLQ